jgi:hypothetical protein
MLAVVCARGHVISDSISRDEDFDDAPNFCQRCGARVLTKCPSARCPARILGHRLTGTWGSHQFSLEENWRAFKRAFLGQRRPDPFCWKCGKPYPWTTREERILRLYSLSNYQPNLDEADCLTIQEQIAVLSAPKASDQERVEAGSVIKRLAPKGWEVMLPVLQTLLSAEIRRQLGLPLGGPKGMQKAPRKAPRGSQRPGTGSRDWTPLLAQAPILDPGRPALLTAPCGDWTGHRRERPGRRHRHGRPLTSGCFRSGGSRQ